MSKRKTTEAFKQIMFEKRILHDLGWKGACMLFPYTWNGEKRYAKIKLKDLMKITTFDHESL